MTFDNEKKTFLSKLDKSKKGSIDSKIIPLLNKINSPPDYYTTSSCSGRVYLWKGTGKKSETEWLKVSHDIINTDFFKTNETDLVWLRLEGVILHIACRNLEAANVLLDQTHKFYKKSCILSASNKIMVEIRGSEFIEMPLYQEGKMLFSGDLNWLKETINAKLEKMWKNMGLFRNGLWAQNYKE